jgi:chemotaxis protein methyltransferase CheR
MQIKSNEFIILSNIIETETGIKMPETKKIMLESRLSKLMKNIDINSYSELIDSIKKSSTVKEHFFNAVTTNKTDFYREINHFIFMKKLELHNKLKVWSCAASSGEEIYTIVFELLEKGLYDFKVYGSDLDTNMLDKCRNGVYDIKRTEMIPVDIKHRHMLKSKDGKTVKIKDNLKKYTYFFKQNLLDKYYNIDKDLDIIFCRNVLIYFDKTTQEKIVEKLITKLKPNGYLFLGHSESLLNTNLDLIQIKPSIYQKK